MKLIVGLGNPGDKYIKTRHNVGFMVVEQFLKDYESAKDTKWSNEEKFKSDIVEIDWQPKHGEIDRIILVKPKTYMNNSGLAIKLLMGFYKLLPQDVWVIHDDIDIPLGGMRIRLGGGDAGHRGILSIREQLGSDMFWRFRMGIGHPRQKIEGPHEKFSIGHVEKYVVGKFQRDESGKVRELIKKGKDSLIFACEYSLEEAMNTFNTR